MYPHLHLILQGLGATHGKLHGKKAQKKFIKPGEVRAAPLNVIPLKAFQMRVDALVSVVAASDSAHRGLYARVLRRVSTPRAKNSSTKED